MKNLKIIVMCFSFALIGVAFTACGHSHDNSEQQGKESLCFLVELLAAGKEGSFTANLKNPQAQ